MTKNTVHTFFNTDARFEKIIHLPSIVGTGATTPDFEDFLWDLIELKEEHALFKLPAFKGYLRHEDSEELFEDMSIPGKEIRGFVFKMSTPVPTNFSSDGNSWVKSWAYYSTEWAYAPTWEEAEKVLIEWAESKFEAAKEKALNPKES